MAAGARDRGAGATGQSRGAVLRDPSCRNLRRRPAAAASDLIDDEWVHWTASARGVGERRRDAARDLLRDHRHPGARHTIAVIGDSHAQQITSALLRSPRPTGGEWSSSSRGAARWVSTSGYGRALRRVARGGHRARRTSATRCGADGRDALGCRGGRRASAPGIERFLDRMDDAGVPVLGVRDNPRFAFNMYDCVVGSDDPLDCAVPRSASLADRNPADDLDRPGLHLVDLTPWICPTTSASARSGTSRSTARRQPPQPPLCAYAQSVPGRAAAGHDRLSRGAQGVPRRVSADDSADRLRLLQRRHRLPRGVAQDASAVAEPTEQVARAGDLAFDTTRRMSSFTKVSVVPSVKGRVR